MAPLLQLTNITKTYNNIPILKDINLELHPGETLALIGPSGTGKSSLLRIIAGLTSPDRGQIHLNGIPRTGTIEDNLHQNRISMVFQQSALFDSLTVEENIAFHLLQNTRIPRKEITQLVNQTLKLIGLPNINDRYPAELSGGMKKRISFARAIIQNPHNPDDTPQLLLYDEPTAGLDPIASTLLENLIQTLHKSTTPPRSHIIVTHQHSTLRRTADRIILLHQGQIQWQGTQPQLDTDPNPHLQQFLTGSPTGPIQPPD